MAVFQLDYVRINVLRVWEKKKKLILMTVIEIRPHRWGWKVFEAPGVELVVPEKDQAINYARNRASFRPGEIHVWIQPAISNAPFRSRKRRANRDFVASQLDRESLANAQRRAARVCSQETRQSAAHVLRRG
jgi:hypothetical protein